MTAMTAIAPAEPTTAQIPEIGDPKRPGTVLMIVGALIALVGVAWFVLQPSSEPSSFAPALALPSAAGEGGAVGLPVGEPAVVVFVGPFCNDCEQVTNQVFGLNDANRIVVNTFTTPESSLVDRSAQAGVGLGLDKSGDAASRFGITTYPTTVIVDSNGLIAARYEGSVDVNRLSADLVTASKAE